MTYLDAWARAPDGATIWFPEGGRAFHILQEGIKRGRFRGRQADHLVWQAKLTRAELEALLEECFGAPGQYEAHHDRGLQHLADRMRKLRAFVAAQPPDAEITVMADEF